MGGVRNDGLWPILMCEITLFCLSNPERDMRFFFFPCVFKAKYYPFILFAVFTLLSNFNINFELIFISYCFYFILIMMLKKTEEVWLLEKFGDEYAEYAAKTNRIFPGPQK